MGHTAVSRSQQDSVLGWWYCSTTWHIIFVGIRSQRESCWCSF